MSDLMFYGVLRMPYEMAMDGEISRIQFYERAQTAADRVEAADARIEVLERFVASCAEMGGEQVVGDSLAANAKMVLAGRAQQERAAAPQPAAPACYALRTPAGQLIGQVHDTRSAAERFALAGNEVVALEVRPAPEGAP